MNIKVKVLGIFFCFVCMMSVCSSYSDVPRVCECCEHTTFSDIFAIPWKYLKYGNFLTILKQVSVSVAKMGVFYKVYVMNSGRKSSI